MAACERTQRLGSRKYVCIGDRDHDKGQHYYVQDDEENDALAFWFGVFNGLALSSMMVLLTVIVCLYVFA